MLAKKIAAAALGAMLALPGVAYASPQGQAAAVGGILDAALEAAGSPETRALLEGALEQVTSPESKAMVRGLIEELPPEQRDALLENFDQVWEQLTDAGKLLLAGYSEQLRAIDGYGPDSFEAAFAADMSNRQRLTVIDAAANGDEEAKAALQDSNVQRVRSEVADSARVDDDASSRSGSRSGDDDDDSSASSGSDSSGNSGGSRSSGGGSASSSSGGTGGGSSSTGGGASGSASGGSSGSENSSGSGSSGNSGGTGGAGGAAPIGGGSGAQDNGAGDVAAVSGNENSAAPGADGANDGGTPDEDAGGTGGGGTQNDGAGDGGGAPASPTTDRFAPPPEGQAGIINAPDGRAIQTEDGDVVSISSIQSPDDPLYQSLPEEDQQYVATRRATESSREYHRGVDQTTEDLDRLHDESGQGLFNRRGESLATYEAQRNRVTDGLARDEANLQTANEWSEAAGRSGNIRERSYAGGDPEERISEMDRSRRYTQRTTTEEAPPETPAATATQTSSEPEPESGGTENA